MISIRLLCWWLRCQTRHGSVPWTDARLRSWYRLEAIRNAEVNVRLLCTLLRLALLEAWRVHPMTVAAERIPSCLLPSLVSLAHSRTDGWKVCQRGLGIVRVPWWLGRKVWGATVAAATSWLLITVRVLIAAVLVWAWWHGSESTSLMTATTYYVSPFGSDANNGQNADPTQSSKPWLTLAKPLGASGFASGDTCYVAPGIYTEDVTVAMTSATVTTTFAGDPSNAQGFCDGSGVRLKGGPVVWISASPSGAASLLTYSGRDFLALSDFTISGDGNGTVFDASSTTSTNCSVTRCQFFQAPNNTVAAVTLTTVFGTALAWTFADCTYTGRGRLAQINLPSGAGSDYDANVIFQNCVGAGTDRQLVAVSGSGASAKFGGGVLLKNCTSVSGGLLTTSTSTLSTSIPCQALNSFAFGVGASLSANASGQITEDYNLLYGATARTNVTAGAHSLALTAITFLIESFGTFSPFRVAKLFTPVLHSVNLGFGNSSGTTTDLNGLPRPCGTMTFGDSGTATSGAAGTLTDSGKTWGTNYWSGSTTSAVHWMVKITGGTGSGQVKQIKSNTATVLTVDGNWNTNPDNTSTYTIYAGQQATSGKATAGGATTLTDSNAAWATNQWTGWTLEITSGTGNGQSKSIASNTATVFTVSTWGTNPDSTSVYKVYRGSDENTVLAAAGAYERGNTMVLQTATVRTGSNALRAIGPATQDIDIPVSAAATTVKVWTRFNSTYAGTKPQLKVLNGEECGVSAASTTATGSADTWEELTLSFTPARAGVVTLRLQANSTATLGLSYFDDLSMTPAVNPLSFDQDRRGDIIAAMAYTGAGYSRGRVVNS